MIFKNTENNLGKKKQTKLRKPATCGSGTLKLDFFLSPKSLFRTPGKAYIVTR